MRKFLALLALLGVPPGLMATSGIPVTVPQYTVTAAEIAAGVSPVRFGYPVYNVLRYGCDPTGATSSTTCFTNAGAVATSAGGATIVVPAGTYKASGITFLSSNIYLKGDGTNATFIQNSATNTPTFTWGNGSTSYFNGGVSGITFSSASGVTGVAGQTGFSFLKTGQFSVVDVFVTNLPAALYRGVWFSAASQFHVERLRVQGCIFDGITFLGTTDTYVLSSRSDANGAAGWVFNNAQGGFFAEDTSYNNSGIGWNFTSTTPASGPNFNNKFTDIVADTSGSYNIQINDCINCYFTNPWAATQQSTTVNTFATGIVMATQYSKGITITGGQAINNNSHGVQVFDSGANSPSNITIENFQFGSTQNGTNGNGRAAGGGYGATINGAANHVRIIGGMFDGNATGAFLNQSSGNDITVCGNPVGFITTNQGSSAVTVGTAIVTVTHGLGFTPNAANIQVTPLTSETSSSIANYWISGAPTSTTFQVATNVNAVANPFNFAWRASYNGC